MHSPDVSSAPTSATKSNKLAAIAGLAYALVLFTSLAMIDPLHGGTAENLQAWWTDDALLSASVTSMFLKLVAAGLFLVFVTQLRARLRGVEREALWGDLVHSAGIVSATALSIGALPRAVIAQYVRSGAEPLPGPDTLRYATYLSDAVFGLVAIPFAALVVLVASVLFIQTGLFSKWLGGLGVIVGVASLAMAAIMMGPWASPLILLWVAGVSVQLFRMRTP